LKARILLIEDDADLLQLFTDALNASGYYVDKFTNPLEALSIFEHNSHNYDLILSDVRMPEINGIDLIKKMKNINDNVTFVLMSAFDVSNYQEEMEEMELKTFMKKPMHIEQFIKAVNECIKHSNKTSRTEMLR
jgi:DNA-binding NtrC family response regulator